MLFIVEAFKWTVLIYLAAAVLPAFFLLRYIYLHDRIEKEPQGLLLSLFLLGVASALCASVAESLLKELLDRAIPNGGILYTVILSFIVVAMVEEGAKFLFLKRCTWNHPAFDCRFDAIIYAVFVSLGFAAYENILYVFRFGLTTAVLRAVTAIPAHMSFAVLCGVFYGRAKRCELYGRDELSRWNLQMSYVMAVVFHGVYDTCAMLGSKLSMAIFVVFVAVMFQLVFSLVKRESKLDQWM
jgi:RsiW-degrading membrane proteinase PrsW (M82 family)